MENNQNNKSEEQNNQNNSNNQNNKKKPSGTAVILILSIVLTLFMWSTYDMFKSAGQEKVSYDEFIEMLEDGQVENVKIYNSKIIFESKEKVENEDYNKAYYVIRTDDYNIVERLYSAGVSFEEIDEGKSAIMAEILSFIVMIIGFYILMLLIMRNAGKSGAFGV